MLDLVIVWSIGLALNEVDLEEIIHVLTILLTDYVLLLSCSEKGGTTMEPKEKLRNETLESIQHTCSVFLKAYQNSGGTKVFDFSEMHKIATGLYLAIWTRWEEYCRQLLVLELIENEGSIILQRVKKFRTKKSASILANSVIEHIDHPDNFNTWSSFEVLLKRARKMVGDNNAFRNSGIDKSKLKYIYKIRNFIAHSSDKAKSDFMKLLSLPPFSLSLQQKQGITAGRLLCNQGTLNPLNPQETVFISIANIIKGNIKLLVP